MSHENKTEQPTEKRLQEARDRGQFARSPELQMVAGLLATFAVILFAGKQTGIKVSQIWVGIFSHLKDFQITGERAEDWTKISMFTMLELCLPVLTITMAVSIAVGLLQTRFTLSPKALGMKFERLNPGQGLKRIFSSDGAMKLLVDSLKLGIVGSLVYSASQTILHDPIFYTEVESWRLGQFIYDSALMLIIRLAAALGGLALLSYLYQRHKINQQLMMSREEVKEEHRSSEGDPLIRAMRRQMARRLLQKQMLSKIATADVVITNPTHFAIALKYERGVDQAPVILAKGENAFARRIKALAAEHGVPMVENKPVARMLFKYGKVGKAIPIQLYQAVAEILGFVYRTHRLYFHELKQRRLTA